MEAILIKYNIWHVIGINGYDICVLCCGFVAGVAFIPAAWPYANHF
jgi:hypothetical protein